MKLGTRRLQREFVERPLSALTLPRAEILDPSARIASVIAAMHSARPLGSVLVRGAGEQVEGIITERDLLKLDLWERSVHDLPASAVRSKKLVTLPHRASLGRALHLMMTERYRQIPLLDQDGRHAGMVTVSVILNELHTRLTSALTSDGDGVDFGDGPLGLLLTDSVGVLMKDPPLCCEVTTPVPEAINLMRRAGKGAISVVNSGRNVIGIFTEHDYVKRANAQPWEIARQTIGDLMTRSPTTVLESTSIAYTIKVCATGKFRHAPIVSAGEEFLGMASVRHLVSALAEALVAELAVRAPRP